MRRSCRPAPRTRRARAARRRASSKRRRELRRGVLHRHQALGESGDALGGQRRFEPHRALADRRRRHRALREQAQILGRRGAAAVHAQRERRALVGRLQHALVALRVLRRAAGLSTTADGNSAPSPGADARASSRARERRKLRSTAFTSPLRRGESQPRGALHRVIDDRVVRGAGVLELVERRQQEGSQPRIARAAGRAARRAAPRGGRESAACRRRGPGARRARALASRGCRAPNGGELRVEAAPREHPSDGAAREPLDLNHRPPPSRAPAASLKPARNSPAASRLPPARCNSVTRKPSRPHATTMPEGPAAHTVPGSARRAALDARAPDLQPRRPSSRVSAPGTGSNARTCRSISSRRALPVDLRLLLAQLPRIGRAARRPAAAARGARRARARSAARRVQRACRAACPRCRLPRSAAPPAAVWARCRDRRPSA